MQPSALHSVPDDELLARLADLLRESRRTESELVAHIAEVDARKLYARQACPSMFAYCTEALHLSEAEAYLRIAAARASREYPLLLEMLADGRLHLSGIGKLSPHLKHDNAAVLLTRAAHKSKRQIEELIAALAPRPDAPSMVRKLPESAATTARSSAPVLPLGRVAPSSPVAGSDQATLAPQARPDRSAADREPSPLSGNAMDGSALDGAVEGTGGGGSAMHELRPDAVASPRRTTTVLEPLAAGRYRVQFTASAALKDKLARLQALMRSQLSGGDLAGVIEAAVTEKLERLEARRFARTSAARKALEHTMTAPCTRHIPAAVRRAVDERDGGRCCYRDAQGRRCSEGIRLEFHHRHPFGRGGDHSPANVALLCVAHNRLMAEHDYGPRSVVRDRRSGSGAEDPRSSTLRG